jgi:O-antigen ligase
LEKNALGTLCWITGVFYFWSLLSYKKEIIVHVVFLIMIAWLLKMSDSATSQGCLFAGIIFLLLIRNQGVRRYLGTLLLVGFASYLIVLTSTELAPNLLAKMGRDSTLTDRLPIWTAVLEMAKNPLIGTGFESFWLGERLAKLWGMWKGLNNAHNGYLETYLNLGVIGLLLLIGVIGGAYIKCRRELMSNFESGSLRIAFLFLVLLSNVTEATFHGINLVLCIFLIIAIDYFPLKAGEIAGERSPYEVLSSPLLSSAVEREGEFEGEKAIDMVK